MTAPAQAPRQATQPDTGSWGGHPAGCRIELHASTSAMPRDVLTQWSDLVWPGSYYGSPEWIVGLEAAHGPAPILTVHAGQTLTGALPTWSHHDTSDGLFRLPVLTAGLPGPWRQDWLWAGAHRGTANALLAIDDPALRPAALGHLLEAAWQLAQARGLAGVVWPYLPGRAALEAALAHPHAQAVLHAADTVAPVPRGGMAAIAAAATSHRRKEIHRERRRFWQAAGPVTWHALTPEIAARITPLLARTRSKYGASGGEGWMQRILAGQFQAGTTRSAVVALAGGPVRPSAAAMFYEHRRWLYGRYWGAAEQHSPAAYMELTIYSAAHGLTHLHLSVLASRAKTARTYPLAWLVLPVHSPAVDPAVLAAANARTGDALAGPASPDPSAADSSWNAWRQPTHDDLTRSR